MAGHGKAQAGTRAPRRGAEEWRELLADFDLHEGTKAEFCRHRGISPGSLSYWRGQVRGDGLCQDRGAGFGVWLGCRA